MSRGSWKSGLLVITSWAESQRRQGIATAGPSSSRSVGSARLRCSTNPAATTTATSSSEKTNPSSFASVAAARKTTPSASHAPFGSYSQMTQTIAAAASRYASVASGISDCSRHQNHGVTKRSASDGNESHLGTKRSSSASAASTNDSPSTTCWIGSTEGWKPPAYCQVAPNITGTSGGYQGSMNDDHWLGLNWWR